MIWQRETEGQLTERKKQWHSYFTWWPTAMDDGRVFWLERIERRLSYRRKPTGWGDAVDVYEYRYPAPPPPGRAAPKQGAT